MGTCFPAIGGVGVALVGTSTLKSLIESLKGSHSQIYTRVNNYMFIGGLKKPGELVNGVPNTDVENHVRSVFPDATKTIINTYYNTRKIQVL